MTDPRAYRSSTAPRAGLALGLSLGLMCVLGPQVAEAAGVTVGGKAGTGGASGSSSAKGKKGGFKLPDRVAQGNAISLLMPVQVGFTQFMPRVRIGVQYDRQILKSHWVYVGAAALLDRGDYKTFRLGNCGLGDSMKSCNSGTVAGFDIYAGYAHKWYLEEYPWLVPIARGAIGGGAWYYPSITGSRQQARESSWTLNIRPGGGVRFFPILDLAIGFDVNFVFGAMVSKDLPLAAKSATKTANFLVGMEILPLIIEYRF